LAIFNLIPVPPLDGSAVIERLMPRSSLGAYYQFRARALPLVMVLVVVDSLFFHRLNGLFNTIESWWISLAS
jgi:Zn-dependent protease